MSAGFRVNAKPVRVMTQREHARSTTPADNPRGIASWQIRDYLIGPLREQYIG